MYYIIADTTRNSIVTTCKITDTEVPALIVHV